MLIFSLLASILRDASYSAIRIGAYEPFKELLGADNPYNTPLWKKITAGIISGVIGSVVANPADLVKIRLQAEGHLKPGIFVFESKMMVNQIFVAYFSKTILM